MSTALQDDLDRLEQTLRQLIQTLKRPHAWAVITARANVRLERPAAAILFMLTASDTPEGCHLRDLADGLGIEAPSVTRQVQNLERQGLLTRQPDDEDRRAIGLRVTAAGKKAAKRLRSAQRALLTEALKDWPPAERRQLADLISRFSNDLSGQYKRNSL